MNAKEMIKECESLEKCDRCRCKRECGLFSEAIRKVTKPSDWKKLIREMREIG